jgi:hypothetical protein
MSRQFSFFIDESSYKEIDELVFSLGGTYIASPRKMKTRELKTISSLSVWDKDDTFRVYLCIKGRENEIILKEVINIENETIYPIDQLRSPIIEFDRCFYNKEFKKMNDGRVYYNKGYWGDDHNFKTKNETFLKFADEFFKKLKKILVRIREGKFEGWYVSKEVLEKVKNNELQLKFAHEPW